MNTTIVPTNSERVIKMRDSLMNMTDKAIKAELKIERLTRNLDICKTSYEVLDKRYWKSATEKERLREALKPLAELSPYGCPFCEEHSLPTGAEHNCTEVPTAIAARVEVDADMGICPSRPQHGGTEMSNWVSPAEQYTMMEREIEEKDAEIERLNYRLSTLEEDRLERDAKIERLKEEIEIAECLQDSQYLAGVTAGWNAANSDNPNEAKARIYKLREGRLKPLFAIREKRKARAALNTEEPHE